MAEEFYCKFRLVFVAEVLDMTYSMLILNKNGDYYDVQAGADLEHFVGGCALEPRPQGVNPQTAC